MSMKAKLNQYTALVILAAIVLGVAPATVSASDAEPVSYSRDIRPIFAARCFGCHQPATPSGQYSMTSFDRLIALGERGEQPIVAGKPDESLLVSLITPIDGDAEMPGEGAPLSNDQIELIKRWIAEGAQDDSGSDESITIDAEHPPVYTQQPVVTSIDYSPDGQLLAIAGYHEVRLYRADGFELVGRLIGLAERIETLKFSPDGSRLAVAGGNPALTGEIQVWDVASQELVLSHTIGFDTLRGVSWSPDGKQIAFGATDNTVRAIDAATGKQLLFQSAPNDWPLDTVYSVDGSHLVTVGRDMTAKLIEVPNERFVDNITSITPGALKGGIHSVARHPLRDEILFGGADGVPRMYRMHRQTKRVIGDDANLLLEFPPLPGRIFSVDISCDGSLIAAGSSLNGQGAFHLYHVDPELTPPEEIQKLLFKPTHSRSAEETKQLKDYFTKSVKVVAQLTYQSSPIYSVAISPDGESAVASGGDGVVRVIDTKAGELRTQFDLVQVDRTETVTTADTVIAKSANSTESIQLPGEVLLPEELRIAKLIVEPERVEFASLSGMAQLVVTAALEDGRRFDVTRSSSFAVDKSIAHVDRFGLLRPTGVGDATIKIDFRDATTDISFEAANPDQLSPDYIRDVNPVLTRAGCNAGTCHGSKDGKNGFKLSLRGYDPLFDIRSLTDDHASRRVNLASPSESLILQKATAKVPHEGGQAIEPDSRYYETLRKWVESGARLDAESPRVSSIEISPRNPVVEQTGENQQFRVVAHYDDGISRDVTTDAFIEIGNTDVAEPATTHAGLMHTLRRGESPVLVRYEGAYAATTLTVMGDRSGFQWREKSHNNPIDQFVADKLKRTKTLPAPLADDYTFVRRIYLDLTGLPPTLAEIGEFIDDSRDTKEKRAALIDKLVGNDEFVEHWSNKWADLLQVNGKFLGREGAIAFRQWIRSEIAANTPYDEFVTKILTASGSNRENPPASYFKILRTPEDTMENSTHLFLSTRFNCNKCHDHPFERWTQDEYYELAAYFAQVKLDRDPASGDRSIGKTAVEENKPLFEIVADAEAGEMIHERTGQVAAPSFPYEIDYATQANATRRQQLAAWVTSSDNPYFARSYANRLWGYLLGAGIIEPIDDIRAGNPPSNPELLDYLTNEFINSNFDTQHLVRLICKSQTYQRSVAANQWNVDDKLNFSHARTRRLPAEVLYDSVHRATGSVSHLPGVPVGTRAAALPDSGIKLSDGFLDNLGRPARESACECERVSEMQLGSVMAFVTGPTIGNAIGDPKNEITRLAASDLSDEKLVEEIYLRILNRPPTPQEIRSTQSIFTEIKHDHDQLISQRDEYAAKLSTRLAKQELIRQQSVIRLTAELESHRQAIAPEQMRLKEQRDKAIAKAQHELNKHEESLTASLGEWESELRSNHTTWVKCVPQQMATTLSGELIAEADGSIFAKVKPGNGEYTMQCASDGVRISAIRLEAFPDDRLPSAGPGLADNGNFVLTEFSAVIVTPANDAAEESRVPVSFESARADFSQEGFDVSLAIDGNLDSGSNGWAINGQTGKRHVALFEFAEPIELAAGQLLEFRFQHSYSDPKHQLGRFRLSTTEAKVPVDFGLPPEIDEMLQLGQSERTPDQAKLLLDYRRQHDGRLKELERQLATASAPIAVDVREAELQQQLQAADRPLPIDARLRHLEREIALSQRQLSNLRLTAAQDLTWALINSPAFLYNH